jgi:LmbE family N-acetylglucosaminyl deacetylase
VEKKNMGQSTDAILTYGIAIETDSEAWEVCEKLQDERYDEHTSATKELGVEAIGHCSGDYRMYIVGAHETKAWRGNPREIAPDRLALGDAETRTRIKAFCERFGLPFDDAACKWWLASDWC